VAGVAGAHQPPVTFNRCANVENVIIHGTGVGTGQLKSTGNSYGKNLNVKNLNGYLVISNTTTIHSIKSYGQLVIVDSIRVLVYSKSGWQGAEIKAFADEALTIQIGATLNPAGGTSTSPEVHSIVVPSGTFTKDGVYVTIKNTNGSGGVEGFVSVETLSC
jgi:hypothetical protein